MDDPRRHDVLLDVDKRLALLEQARKLEGEAASARSAAHDRAIEALSVKVDAAITLWTTVTAEPAASPAGRAILAELAEQKHDLTNVEHKVGEHESFIQQVNGATRLAKFAIGTSLLAVVVQVLALYNSVAA